MRKTFYLAFYWHLLVFDYLFINNGDEWNLQKLDDGSSNHGRDRGWHFDLVIMLG